MAIFIRHVVPEAISLHLPKTVPVSAGIDTYLGKSHEYNLLWILHEYVVVMQNSYIL